MMYRYLRGHNRVCIALKDYQTVEALLNDLELYVNSKIHGWDDEEIAIPEELRFLPIYSILATVGDPRHFALQELLASSLISETEDISDFALVIHPNSENSYMVIPLLEALVTAEPKDTVWEWSPEETVYFHQTTEDRNKVSTELKIIVKH